MHDLVMLYAMERARKKEGEDGAEGAVLRYARYCMHTEYVRQIGVELIVDDHPLFESEWCEELGDFIFKQAAELPHGVRESELREALSQVFDWDEERRAWVQREQSETAQLAWEATDTQFLGDRAREADLLVKLASAYEKAGNREGAALALHRLGELGLDIGRGAPSAPAS